MRPILDIGLGLEAVRVGQMLYCLKKVRAPVWEFKVDSVLFTLPARRECCIGELTHKDLTHLRDMFELPGFRRLDQYCIMAGCNEAVKVFRVTKASETDLMKGEATIPTRKDTDPYSHTTREWCCLTEREAEAKVLNEGASLFCQGIAGTGKTHYMKGLIARLRALGKKVDLISKTHTACSRMGPDAMTCDAYSQRKIRHGVCNADVIWLDEASQVECELLVQLNKLSPDIQWIISADFNQFSPVMDNFRGNVVNDEALKDSRLLFDWCVGNLLTLTTCRRSDAALFSYYSSLIPGGCRYESSLQEVVAEARLLFPVRSEPAQHHLVISHVKRVRLNKEVNQKLKPKDATLVRTKYRKGMLNRPQNMFIWKGLELLGCVRGSQKGIKNNVFYIVEAIGDATVTLEGKESKQKVELTFEQLAQWTRLSHAQTYASIQGCEYNDTICLHDSQNPRFSRRHLFVAISRATEWSKVQVS